MQCTPKVTKPALVKLTSNHILQLLSMIAWGVGAMLLNMLVKLECNENLAFVIRMTQTKYEKALKGV